MTWTHAGPALIASFLASMVEFVEALTIVLAVGTIRGWKSAMYGTFGGVALLVLMVGIFGPALNHIPLHTLQLVIGVLLLLFGIRWLRKAVLRAGGKISLHDEAAAYEKTRIKLSGAVGPASTLDGVAVVTAFKAVVLEGLEVVFIVIATGANGMLIPASAGALAAGLVVISLGIAIHKPLTRIPENTLKYAVGVILTSFGTFWIGEGSGMAWPGKDESLFALATVFLVASLIAVSITRSYTRVPQPETEVAN